MKKILLLFILCFNLTFIAVPNLWPDNTTGNSISEAISDIQKESTTTVDDGIKPIVYLIVGFISAILAVFGLIRIAVSDNKKSGYFSLFIAFALFIGKPIFIGIIKFFITKGAS